MIHFYSDAAVSRAFSRPASTRFRCIRRNCVEIEPSIPQRFRPMDNRHMLGDASALRDLGWSAQIPLKSGVEHYVQWIRSQGDVDEAFTRAEARLRELGIVREVRA